MTVNARAAIVGTGSRAQQFTEGLARREHIEVAALCDPNQVRMEHHNRLLAAAGRPPAALYTPDRFAEMLRAERVDTVVVTTVDALHDGYIVSALRAGCRVVTEKPLTTDAERCHRILDTVTETGGDLSVAFNYRFNPVHELVRTQLRQGAIGDIISVHFEWLLDVRHGADYFRRWHREKANSGGLMVHKSGHHFDLVNWWLDARPQRVFGLGRLAFYGRENGERTGYRRDYERAHGSPAAADDPFALHLEDNEGLRALYLDAEKEDGYHRDQNVFGDGITIEDDMTVAVRYRSGATMSYHLTAYSPWEGYHVAFNGSEGRLELDVVENSFVDPGTAGKAPGEALHGVEGTPDHSSRLTVRRHWEKPVELDLPDTSGEGHGGGDARMLADIFGPGVDGTARPVDPLGRASSHRDGALSLLTGLAANRSFETGLPVHVDDVLAL
jgi:predicted dehydrogenase